MVIAPQFVWIVARAGGAPSLGLSSRPSGLGFGAGTLLHPGGTGAPAEERAAAQAETAMWLGMLAREGLLGERAHGVSAEEYTAALGFRPALRLSGPVDTALDAAVSDEVLLVLREALSNIARHASASAAQVELTASAAWFMLRVTDDGVGMTPAFSCSVEGRQLLLKTKTKPTLSDQNSDKLTRMIRLGSIGG